MSQTKAFGKLQKHFAFPFEPHDFQEEALHEMVPKDCSLLRFKVGLGKTFTSILAALHYSVDDGIEQILILCPPILIDQWKEFVESIDGIPEVCAYRGTPTERAAMDMEASVLIASYNIFRGKKDYPRFKKLCKNNKMCIIADELSLKNLKSQTYRKLKEIVYRKMRIASEDRPHHKLIALNATPISDLGQVYNWCSLFIPGVYRSKRLFEKVHVVEQDHWGNVVEWTDVETMQQNMDLFTIDTSKEIKLPPLVETTIPYDLSKAHRKLYNEVKEAELANLPEEKIELAINSMFNTLQRLILVPREFGLDEDPPILEFINGYLEQVDEDDGILIYSRHVMVSQFLERKIPGTAAIYGGVSKSVRDSIFKLLKKGECRRLVGNLDSLGVGLNLQMLNHILYVELPFRADKLEQSSGRVHRQGQNSTCFANYPLAKDTLQYRIYNRLLRNKEDIGQVIKTKEDAREFLD